MGWLWSSPTPSTGATTSSPTNIVATAPNPEPPSSPSAPETSQRRPKRSATRDEIAEAELQSFLQELEADTRPSPTNHSHVRKPTPSHRPTSSPSKSSPSKFTLEEELLPTDMSCRQAFDAAFYCQSLGGQFMHVYRYGGMGSCSENWKDFWFCMRIKSYTEDQKKCMIRDHYKKKSLKYKLGPSSEDVWESRDKRLAWGEAFSEPVDWFEGTHEEWDKKLQLMREGKVDDQK